MLSSLTKRILKLFLNHVYKEFSTILSCFRFMINLFTRLAMQAANLFFMSVSGYFQQWMIPMLLFSTDLAYQKCFIMKFYYEVFLFSPMYQSICKNVWPLISTAKTYLKTSRSKHAFYTFCGFLFFILNICYPRPILCLANMHISEAIHLGCCSSLYLSHFHLTLPIKIQLDLNRLVLAVH